MAIVTIDNPPMNALDVATKEDVFETLTELAQRKQEIRVAILRGGGGKAFAAGADIKSFLELDPDSARRRLDRSHQIYAIVENYEWPVIAAIQGYCLGGGLELALCCDIRYAGANSKFGFPEVSLGIFPGNGGTKRSLYSLSIGKVKELIYSGEIIGAREALEIGMVEKVVPEGEVMDAVLEVASKIRKRGSLAVAAAKRVLNRTRDLSLEQGLQLEAESWSDLAATEDMKEGVKAFIEKRKPKYKCR
jgi:enoyl-CoA hydratase/carnithine racemase